MTLSSMPYLNELRYNKRNQFPHSSRLRTFNEKPKVSLSQTLQEYFREYCTKSSVHCIHYLADRKLYCYQRLCWGVVFIMAALSTAYFYKELAEIFYTRRSLTTVDDSLYPTMFVEFPAVGICSPPIENVQKIKLAMQTFLPNNFSDAQAQTFETFFMQLNIMTFENISALSTLFSAIGDWNLAKVNPILIDHINITAVMNFISKKCEDLFVDKCYWHNMPYNCCEVFKLQQTKAGRCLVFNSLIDGKWHKDIAIKYLYSKNPGGENGLRVRMKFNKTLINMDPINIVITHPLQWSGDRYEVTYNTRTRIDITPEVTEAEQNMRQLSLDLRRCLFIDETSDPMYKTFYGLPYYLNNCIGRCYQTAVVNKCKCNLSLFFANNPLDKVPDCRVSDYQCIYSIRNLLTTLGSLDTIDSTNDKINCTCMTNCRRVLYKSHLSGLTDLRNSDFNSTDLASLRLAVFYNHVYMVKYITNIRFTFTELLASFGGVIGLFLGSSLLTVIEFIYVVTIGLYGRIQQHRHLYESNKKVTMVTPYVAAEKKKLWRKF